MQFLYRYLVLNRYNNDFNLLCYFLLDWLFKLFLKNIFNPKSYTNLFFGSLLAFTHFDLANTPDPDGKQAIPTGNTDGKQANRLKQ